MCSQRSRTYSWHAVGCYAVFSWGNSVSAEGKRCLKQARFGFQKAENMPIQTRKCHKLFTSSKLQLGILFLGSLPRGSLDQKHKSPRWSSAPADRAAADGDGVAQTKVLAALMPMTLASLSITTTLSSASTANLRFWACPDPRSISGLTGAGIDPADHGEDRRPLPGGSLQRRPTNG